MNKRDIFGFRNLIKKDGWRVGLNASAGDTGIFSVPAATQFNKRECPLSIHLFLINYSNPKMSANIDRKGIITKY